jgi:hypothetical protein
MLTFFFLHDLTDHSPLHGSEIRLEEEGLLLSLFSNLLSVR